MPRSSKALAPILTPSLLHALRTHPHLPPHTWYCIAGVTLSMVNRPEEIGTVLRHALQPFQHQHQHQHEPNQGLSRASSSASASASPGSVSGSDSEGSGLPTGGGGAAGWATWNGRRDGGSEVGEDLAGRSGAGTGVGELEEQLKIARRLREALLKASVVGGLPKTINALLSLKSATPEPLLDPPLGRSPTGRAIEIYDASPSAILHRGQAFFERIYGKVARRVMGQMDRCGTEDLGLLARVDYAYVLSNTAVLSAAESSFVLLAGLIPQDVNPQLKGHLKGALNNGATVEQVRAVREVVIRICEASGMRRLDAGDGESGGGKVKLDGDGDGEGDGNPSPGWGWREEVANIKG